MLNVEKHLKMKVLLWVQDLEVHKKEGEQMAAKNCLIHFGVYNEDGDEEVDEVVEISSDDEVDAAVMPKTVKLDELESTSSSYESVSDDEDIDPVKEVVKTKKNTTDLKCPDCKKDFKITHTYLNHISKKVCQKKK